MKPYQLCIVIICVLLVWNLKAEAAVEDAPQNSVEIGTTAETAQTGESEQAAEDTKKGIPGSPNRLDRWHAEISRVVVAPANWADRFFADEILDEENRQTRLRTSLGLIYDQEDGLALLSEFKLRLAFPRLQNRLQLLVDEAIEAVDPDDPDDIADAVDESKPGAGLRVILSQDEKKSVSTDFGARFGQPVQLYGRVRGRITVPFGQWKSIFSQTIAYYTEDSWTETTEMRWDRPLENNFLFRSLSRVTWEDKSEGIAPSQSFIMYKKLSPRRGYNFALTGKWPEVPHVDSANYSVTLTYRQQIYRPWLFLQIAPGIEFPQADDYDLNGFITVKLEVVFGE